MENNLKIPCFCWRVAGWRLNFLHQKRWLSLVSKYIGWEEKKYFRLIIAGKDSIKSPKLPL
ncbi:MAG: hypothetical protein Q9M37_01350 [Desulfonauticus sp.]|nr:hypothetical protein [Desulfonauticus sp.]